MPNLKLASTLLRIGLATAFIYAGISALVLPIQWAGFLPDFLFEWGIAIQVLTVFSFFELFLAAWLLSGRKTRMAAIISAAVLVAIIIPNLNATDIIFRDVAIFFAAASLAAMSKG